MAFSSILMYLCNLILLPDVSETQKVKLSEEVIFFSLQIRSTAILGFICRATSGFIGIVILSSGVVGSSTECGMLEIATLFLLGSRALPFTTIPRTDRESTYCWATAPGGIITPSLLFSCTTI